MFFLVRDGVYRPPRDRITFRRFLKEGFEGETATQADWELHLSTVFPEVRLKRTIEVRGADATRCRSRRRWARCGAGCSTIPARAPKPGAWSPTGRWPSARSCAARSRAWASAARFGGRALKDLAVELCRIATAGLARLPGGAADARLLEPLLAYATAGPLTRRRPARRLQRDRRRPGEAGRALGLRA